MRLPVPFEWGGEVYAEAEVKAATAGVIADTSKALKDGNWYAGMQVFVAGCLESLGSQRDLTGIRQAVREMPYQDAEFIAIQVFIAMGVSDDVSALYTCPRAGCGKTITGESEKVGDLQVVESEDPVVVRRELKTPVEVKSLKGEPQCDVLELAIRAPSLGELSKAFAKFGESDLVRVEFAAYVASTELLNGRPPERQWFTTWGMMAFNRMSAEDANAITEEFRRYGVQNRVTKTCPKCGFEWEAEVSTAGFFVSGLRQRQPSNR
jgi:hypothetical protein